jgi:hypothetical protein
MYVDSQISYDKILVFTFQIGDHFYICVSRFLSHLSHKDDLELKQNFSYLSYAFCCFFTIWRIYKIYKIKRDRLKECFGSALVSMGIRIQHLCQCGSGFRIWNQGFYDRKLYNFKVKNKLKLCSIS